MIESSLDSRIFERDRVFAVVLRLAGSFERSQKGGGTRKREGQNIEARFLEDQTGNSWTTTLTGVPTTRKVTKIGD